MEASLNTPAVTAISAGRRRLGALLVADGLVSQHQIETALARQQIERRRLGDVLVREGLVSETDLVEALAAQLRLEVADLDQVYFSPETLALLPRDFMVHRRVLPLEVEDDGTLVLAMTDPLDIVAIDEVRLRTKRNVRAVICTESAFEEASATFFNTRGKLRELSEEEESLVADEAALAHDASIIEIVDGLISDAVSMKASDIHVEPHAEALHVRCRIDGVLHKLREFPVEVQAGIVSRIKIMGNMDIAERRMPQDGRTSFETSSGDAVDLRLACHPDPARREHLDPHPRGLAPAAGARRARPHRALPGALRGGHPPAGGRHPDLRADGLRQVDHAVHHARAGQVAGEQDLHGRGPHRAQAGGGHAERGQVRHRPRLRRACCARCCGATPTSSWWGRSGTRRPPRWRPRRP